MGINDIVQIGNTIKKLRMEKGLTQKEMSDKLGIPPTTYSNYENNHREPNIEILDKISNVLEITTEEILMKAMYKIDSKISDKEYILTILNFIQNIEESTEVKQITDKIIDLINNSENNEIEKLSNEISEFLSLKNNTENTEEN